MRYGTPLLLSRDDEKQSTMLTEVALNESPFREDRLQELISAHPTVLPVTEIEPAFSPLICLGREIPCRSGAIDILFSSPAGQLTLVETKLWDNPESRRTVVGQILEYAKDISHWSFEDLDQAVRRAGIPCGDKRDGIIETVQRSATDFAESSFYDTATRNLLRGNFLLIIAGNGIRENVSEIAEYLQSTPNLHFSLALVELAVYRCPSDGPFSLLIQPRVVTRTLQLTRAVVEVRAPEGFQVSVTLPAEKKGEDGLRRTVTEEALFEKLTENIGSTAVDELKHLIDGIVKLGLYKSWGAVSVSLRFPDPLGRKDFTVLVINHAGRFYLGWLVELEKCGYDPMIAARYRDAVIKLTDAIPSGTDATKETPIQRLLVRKTEYLDILKRFIDELRIDAADKHPE